MSSKIATFGGNRGVGHYFPAVSVEECTYRKYGLMRCGTSLFFAERDKTGRKYDVDTIILRRNENPEPPAEVINAFMSGELSKASTTRDLSYEAVAVFVEDSDTGKDPIKRGLLKIVTKTVAKTPMFNPPPKVPAKKKPKRNADSMDN